MDFPLHFRCPISMEVMKDPVTISTGVTYERKNIETWFRTYNKKTCPATMQSIERLDITPNHTLKRLIHAWRQSAAAAATSSPPPPPSSKHEELVSLLSTMETTPFKVSCLKKLRLLLDVGDDAVKADFKCLGGVDIVVAIIQQILVESSDFVTFRASEEAVTVLYKLPLLEEDESLIKNVLLKPELIKSMALMLQRGSAEARFCTIATFQKISRASDSHQWNIIMQDQGIEFFKSLLEIISDDYICTKESSCALQILIDMLEASRKARLKATEAGGVCTLIDLLPDATGSKCEKIMHLIKLLCECADGRLAFIDHGLGIAAVSKKMLNVSTAATKIGVKIMALICGSHPSERVLEEMLMYGAVKKLVALFHIGGSSSTKGRALKIFKLHGNTWRRHPCFPCDLKDCLGLGTDYSC